MMKFFSKLFFKKDKSEETEKQKGFIKRFIARIEKMSNLLKESKEKAKSTIDESKSRLANLEKSNYDIGKFHLERGNLWDATFRFKFLNKFWPDYNDTKYYLAYCQALRGKNEDAKKIVKEFLENNSNHKKARELFDALEHNKMESLIKKYTEELKKNTKKV